MTPERLREIDRYANSNPSAVWVIPTPWDDMIRELLVEVHRLNSIINGEQNEGDDTVYRTTAFSREDMSRRGRMGAAALHAKHDPKVTTSKAREALYRKFEDEADPDRVLSDEDRAAQVLVVRKAYYARLAEKSANARRERSEARKSARIDVTT